MSDSFAWSTSWPAEDDESWRGDRWLPDWPEEAYLPVGEYALFQRDREVGTWIETRSAAR